MSPRPVPQAHVPVPKARRMSSPSTAGPSNLVPPPGVPAVRHPRRVQSHTSLLGPVLEDPSDRSCMMSIPRRNSALPPSPLIPSPLADKPVISTAAAVGWAVDSQGVDRRKQAWAEKERVILLLGDVRLEAVSQLTSDPKLSDTLLITSRAIFTGPRTTGPVIQTLQSVDVDTAVSEALALSAAYRKKNRKHRPKISSSLGRSSGSGGGAGKDGDAPFDAVIHFVPSALRYDPNQALQRMLQEAIMATTMVTAAIASLASGTSAARREGDLDIPLLHVLPDDPPKALPMVLDRYLSELLPAEPGQQRPQPHKIRPLILPLSAWSAKGIPGTPALSVAHAVLFGNLTAKARKRRAYIPSWDEVLPTGRLAANDSPPFPASQRRTKPTNSLLPVANADLPVPDLAWTHELDRRDSDQSTASSSAASTPYEPLTPREMSYEDVKLAKGVRPELEPSAMTLAEGLSGKKKSGGVLGWLSRKGTSK